MFDLILDNDTSLKLLQKSSADDLFHLVDKSRNSLRDWLSWVDATQSPKNTLEFIENSLKGFVEGSGYSFGVSYQNKLAGVIGYNAINDVHKTGMIGYWLGEPYRGKGIMEKAAIAIVNYGFDSLKLKRIEIRCAVNNIKSQAIPVKLGFVKEGCLRQCEQLHHGRVDHFVYGILDNEWYEKNRMTG